MKKIIISVLVVCLILVSGFYFIKSSTKIEISRIQDVEFLPTEKQFQFISEAFNFSMFHA